MAAFKVWAPNAPKMEVTLAGEDYRMEKIEGGWWLYDLPAAGHGTDYAFRIDEGDTLPDPRSPWQPHGVFGHSRLVDHSLYRWQHTDFRAVPLTDAVFYELHVGTFTPEGTFNAAIEKLDHLADLGVTHVELMPVCEFPGSRGWGYDGVNLYAPHHIYGGPDGLKRLVDACHGRNLAVVLDVVYNHLGPEGNFLNRFGPYTTKRHMTLWGEAINFDDRDSDEVRQYFCDNALMWFRDYRFDGLRLDAVHAYIDMSAVHILEQIARQVHDLELSLGRDVILIAESDLNDPRIIRSPQEGGYGLDAQWSDDFHHALHALLTGERGGYYADFGSPAHLAKALSQGFVIDGTYSHYRLRSHGRPLGNIPGHALVVCMQNHDQVGNRAKGDRITHHISLARAQIGAALLLFTPNIPLLFQGEEWAASTPFLYFTDYHSPELSAAVTDGRRKEFSAFGWPAEEIPDPQDSLTFARSKLIWHEIDQNSHRQMLDWYRQLIALRKSILELHDANRQAVHVQFDDQAQWLIIRRGSVTLACNFASHPQTIAVDSSQTKALILSSQNDIKKNGNTIDLPPESVVIFAQALVGELAANSQYCVETLR